jgi:hypothetical protein
MVAGSSVGPGLSGFHPRDSQDIFRSVHFKSDTTDRQDETYIEGA